MFEKYRNKRNRFLPVLNAVMEGQEFNRSLAERGLKELCALLGDKVELVVSVSVKNIENYIFSTLPDDEARYYLIRSWKPDPVERRAEGRKSLEFDLYIKGILVGILVLEVPDQTAEEEISEYMDWVPMMRVFLYCCFLTEACEEEQDRDCFTGLPGDRIFKQDLKKAVSEEEKGYFLAVRIHSDKHMGDLNETVNRVANYCKSICLGKAYRIGPEAVSMLFYGEKQDAMAAAQELMCEFADCSVLLEPLEGLDADGIYERVGKWCATCGNRISFPRCEGIYPKLPVFEGVPL